MTRLEDAQEAARYSGKLVLVHFYGDHCAPCRRMDAEVFPARVVIDAVVSDYVPVKIDATQSPELVQRFGIRGIPADVILTGDGRVVHRREGGISTGRYAVYLDLVARRNLQPTASVTPAAVSHSPDFESQPSQPLLPNRYSLPDVPAPMAALPVAQVLPWGEPFAVALTDNSVSIAAPEPVLLVGPTDSPVNKVNVWGAMVPPQEIETPMRQTVAIPLALDGFCPVTLREVEKWVTGNPLFCHLHRGQLYRFTDSSAMERFCATPERYAPAVDGNDIVAFVDRQRMVPGVRRFGVWYQERVFLFASRESLEAFAKRPEFFAEIAARYEVSVDTRCGGVF